MGEKEWGKKRTLKTFMLFIHLKTGFPSTPEFVYVYVFHLETVDGSMSFQILWDICLCSSNFMFQKQGLGPWLCVGGAAVSFSLAVLLFPRPERGPCYTLFSLNTLLKSSPPFSKASFKSVVLCVLCFLLTRNVNTTKDGSFPLRFSEW